MVIRRVRNRISAHFEERVTMTAKNALIGFLVIIFLGAALTVVHWSLIIVAGIIGGYLMGTKNIISAFIAGIIAWSLLFTRYVFSDYFGAVNSFINRVAGLPALPVTLVIGGILALMGALIGIYGKKVFQKQKQE